MSRIELSSQKPRTALEPLKWSAAIGLALYCLVCLVGRVIPESKWDAGVYVDVGDLLIRGEKLYVGVWDNKDPLFYYWMAFERSFSPYSDFMGESLIFLVVAVSSFLIVRCLRGSVSVAMLSILPTLLVFYGPEFQTRRESILASCIFLVSLVFVLKRKWAVAGFLVGLLFGVKLILAPAVGLVLLILALKSGNRKNVYLGILGFVFAVLLLFLVLALRGELAGYFYMLKANFIYSQNKELVGEGLGPIQHLKRVADDRFKVTVGSTFAAFLIASVKARRVEVRDFAQAGLIGFGFCLLTLSFVAVWGHHILLYRGFSALAIILLVWTIGEWFTPSEGGLLFVIIAICMAGGINQGAGAWKSTIPKRLDELIQPTKSAEMLNSLDGTGTYSKIGDNSSALTIGLEKGWELECARFHQYSFQTDFALGQLEKCLPKSDVIVFTGIGGEKSADFESWIKDVDGLVEREYVCAERDGIKTCAKKGSKFEAQVESLN